MYNNSIEEKLNTFKEEIVQMKNVDGLLRNIKLYLGKIDAEKEWNANPEEASKRFLHTQSYCDFTDEDSLILLGRTGTGKTAILQCLCDKVNRGEIGKYDIAIIAKFDEILDNIVSELNGIYDLNSLPINGALIKIISIYINCYVMKALIKQEGLVKQNSAMYKYIMDNKLYELGDEKFKNRGTDRIKSMLKASKQFTGTIGEVAKNINVLADIYEAFSHNGYEEAYTEALEILKNKRVLVLVDTINEYDIRDEKIVLCVKALIATCFTYYNNSERNNIYLKVSIPSEIHTHLLERLPGKQQGNTVVIQWSYSDLLKMIAIRLLECFEKDKTGILKFEGRYEYSDFYDDNPDATINAKKILHEILPKSCPTKLRFSFDTLPYCIRHTLRKPREAMAVFNHFINKIVDEKDMKYFIKKPEEISNVIHSTQEDLISSALSMYTTSYNKITEVCEIILKNEHFYFQGKTIDNKLKEATAHSSDYYPEDIKSILMESGLVGKIHEISKKSEVNANDDNSIRMITAKFEYQIKGRLSLNKNDYYVIHPMCYEHFECMVGNRTLVYPDAFDNTQEIMQAVRLKEFNVDIE